MDKLTLSNFFAHFARLLGSGKPLLDALISSGKKSYMKGCEGFVDFLAARVRAGQTLGQALLDAGFPKEYVGYFNVGEWEGRLDRTMDELAIALKADADENGGEIEFKPAFGAAKTRDKKETNAGGAKIKIGEGGSDSPANAKHGPFETRDKEDATLSERGKAQSDEDFDGVETDGKFYDAGERETVRLVNGWFKKCVDARASDLHIIPVRGGDGIVKMRVGGVLREEGAVKREDLIRAVARIKFMSCLDVAEKRLPQDGRMIIRINGRETDLRVSVVPSLTGEKVTIRFISKSEVLIGLDEINMSAGELGDVKMMMEKPYGLILVTGMSGSGKTTTCYSMLNEYVKRGCSVVTIEHPAEYLLNGATQIALDPSIGLNCLTALKTAMRTDPDVIFVSGPFAGDSPDAEIVNYAIKAAQTGHIVICQFGHKNIEELIGSLLNMNEIDAGALANTLNGAIAQALLRKLCGCKTPAGCDKCLNSGYMGRVAVYETIVFGREIKEAIASRDMKKIARLMTGHLEEKAAALVDAGITSIEEVYRVFGRALFAGGGKKGKAKKALNKI